MGNSASTSSADYSQLAELQNKNVIVNIAVTGEAGSGKSTFINALRGLSENDDGAAKTGVTETTMEPTKYSHPSMPNVYLWDLPGMATPNFQVKTYLKNVNLNTYDFFIIVASERFKVNDRKLATEIKKMKKRFYFVRSKIDNDAKTKALWGDFNEERMLTEIRQECEKNLEEMGELKVFLVSSFEPEKYEFQKLVNALKEDFDQGLKRGATSAQRVALTAEDFQDLTAEEAIALSEEHLRNLNTVTINIAVTGESGSGKSSFINAWRGLRNTDVEAAKTGVTETTMEPTRYSHPSMPNVYLWDLPGMATPNFEVKTYLKNVMLKTYDFFIIVASERFNVNHLKLATEIKKMKKQFYFVRSKIDNDAKTEALWGDFNEERMLTEIRQECEKNLKEVGELKVFLVSSFEPEKYEFQKLVDALKEVFDQGLKRGATSAQRIALTVEDFQGLTVEEAIALSEENLRNLNAVTINIAVTGETGSGKSSFINAWCGLCNNDDGAAKTGVTETTMEPTRYSHPSMPNVYLWDLPGIGTSTFNPKKYLKDVRFETYDFFIIISSERFKENDILLAKNIKKIKKLFYFVRSKIDNDVAAESRKRDFNEEQMLTTIREDCEKNLKVVGDPKVFLVSSYKLDKFDFQKLISTLEEDLDEDMGSTLIQSLPVCSLEMIEKKTKMLHRMILLSCFASAGVAMVPVPGLSVAADIGIITSFLTSCYYTFGLNEKNLRMLSTKSNMSVAELKAAMKSIFANGITKELVIRFAGSVIAGAAMTLEYFLSIIPIIGTLLAGGLSFATTHTILNKGLQEMSEAAKRMLTAAGFT